MSAEEHQEVRRLLQSFTRVRSLLFGTKRAPTLFVDCAVTRTVWLF